MASLKSAIVNGAGRCDAAAINQASYVNAWGRESYVANSMPQYCVAFYGNGVVQAVAPIYVGEPMQGGYWVEAQDYPQAIRAYNETQEKAAAAAAQTH
jgi:hypothetical protein